MTSKINKLLFTQTGIVLLFCLLLVIPSKVVAQTPFAFIENGNQWPSKVIARADIEGGRIYLEKDRMTIHLMQSEESGDFHHHFPNKHHVYQIVFEGAQSPTVKKNQVLGGKHNFILGNDKNKWSSNLSAYATLTLENLYPNIDFKIYTRNGRLKYDFVVHPGGDASLIKLRYDFTKGIALNKFTQNLEVNTRFGSGIESQPIYYIDGSDNKLEGNYIVNNNLVSFKVPEYDKDRSTLIIDPILEFASYTGSTSNNFGYTAAPDGEGFLYSGSTVFAQGYPTTTGAFDETYNDGPGSLVDIGLSKWDTTGSKLIWSTYIGGNESEIPHSLFVNDNHELYFLGTTSSLNFPLGPTPYQNSFAGGTSVNMANGLGAIYNNGSDIVLGKLSFDGSTLLSGTYYGGSGNDGLNTNAGIVNQLLYNYADEVRGEIILDDNNNVYIASCTFSGDIGVTGNAAQINHANPASTDGLIAKFDGDLSTLLYGSYYGGTSYDSFYSVKLSPNGNLVAVGGTNSTNYPAVNAFQSTYNGGRSDGAFLVLDPTLNSVLSASYYGTNAYDQIYFTDINRQNEIHFTGQTEATTLFYSTGQPYDNQRSGQYISKFNGDATARIWSTAFGTGGSRPNLAPSAFLVDVCDKIFVAGWGGGPNTSAALVNNNATTVNGMPTTADAQQSATDGNDFYIIVLEADAQSLFYGSFFGGASSQEHIDGGTSRFDKRGKIYQAVCAGCGGLNDFPTTPGVLSNTNNAGTGCNLGVFKFDFLLENTVADFTLPKFLCENSGATYTISPIDKSVQATTYSWDFGDGTTSTSPTPTHTYTEPGVYTVKLIVENPASCNIIDSTSQEIVLLQSGNIGGDTLTLCFDESQQIGISPLPSYGITYTWTPTTGLSNPNISNPQVTATSTTDYTLQITAGACVSNYTNRIVVPSAEALFPDSSVCFKTSVILQDLNNVGAENILWYSDPAYTNNINSAPNEAYVIVSENKTYYAKYTVNGCPLEAEVTLSVIPNTVVAAFDIPNLFCTQQNIIVSNTSSNADTYNWESTKPETSNDFEPNFTFDNPGNYTIELIAQETLTGCLYSDTATQNVTVFEAGVQSIENINACPNTDVLIGINPADSLNAPYIWSPSGTVNKPNAVSNIVNITDSATYNLSTSLNAACVLEYIYNVNVPNPPSVLPDSVSYCTGETITITANTPSGSSNFEWRLNGGNVGNTNSITITPTGTQIYEFYFDFEGCRFQTTVIVFPGGFDLNATFDVDTIACKNQALNFDATVTSGSTVLWNFGDANTSTQEDPSHTYTSEGEYNVRLTVSKSNANCSNQIVLNKRVIILSNSIKQEVNLSLCEGDVVQIGIPQDSLDLTYFWTPTKGLNNPTVLRPTLTAIDSTRYLFIAQKDAACADTTAFNIAVPESPEIVPSDSLVCPNTPIDITPETPVFGIGYQWYADEGLTMPLSSAPDFTLTVSVNTPTTYYISYNFRNCPFVDSIRLTPKVLNIVADFTFPDVVCKEGFVEFTDLSTNVSTYDWDFDDGNTSNLNNPSNTFASEGVYQIQLIGEGTDQNCIGRDTITKQLLVLGDSRINYETIKACIGEVVQLGVDPVSDPSITFSWSPITGLSNPTIPNPTTTASDTITYELFIETGSCRDTLVTQLNVPKPQEVLPNNFNVCLGDSLRIAPKQPYDIGTFTWYIDNAYTTVEPTTSDTLRLQFTADTTFYYSFLFEGCPKTDSLKVFVIGRDVVADFAAPRLACQQDVVTFTQTGTSNTNSKWNFGDGTTSTQTNPTHVYQSNGDFEVQLVIEVNSASCLITDTVLDTLSIYGNQNNLGFETQYCEGDSALIGGSFSYPNPVNIFWTPNTPLNQDTTTLVKTFATDSTTYLLIVSDTLGTCTDTTRYPVYVPKSPSTLLGNKEFCLGDVVSLSPLTSQPITNVKWYKSPVFINPINVGSQTSVNVSPNTEQFYYLGFEYAGCPFRDSTLLQPLNVDVNLVEPPFACYNEEVVISANATPTSVVYIWETDATEITDASLPSNQIRLLATQDEKVKVTAVNHIGCSAADSILFEVTKLTPTAHTIDFLDTLYVKGDTADIAVIPAPPEYVYIWEPQEVFRPFDAAKSQFQVLDNDTVYVTISDGFCNLKLRQRVRVLDNPCGPPDIFVPNAFSPNGDNNNDILKVRGQYIDAMLFRVYDRWGQKVFESRNQDKGWDGTFKGKELDPTVFVYYLEVQCIFGKQYKTKGNVTLLK